MQTAEVGTVSAAGFRITGAYLTRQARELALDGNLVGALELLGDLEGLPLEQAYQILAGELCLTGINEFDIEPESEELRQEWQLNWNDEVETTIYLNGRFRKLLAVRPINNPISSLETEFLLRNRKFPEAHYDMRTLYTCYSPAVIHKAGAQVHFPLEDDIEVMSVGSHVFYAVPVDKNALLPWNRDRIRSLEPLARCESIVNDGLLLDLRSEELRIRASTDLRFMRQALDLEEARYIEEQKSKKAEAPETESEPTVRRRREPQVEEPAFDEAPYREQVTAFADADTEYGWMTVTYEDNGTKTLRIPKRALTCFALSRAKMYHLMPDYEAFSPSSVKMGGDDPFHTDAWLGAGLPLDKAYDYDHPATEAFFDAMHTIQKDLLSLKDFVILNRGQRADSIYGKVVDARTLELTKRNEDTRYILLVPHAGIEFDLAASKADAIITEVGGKLAHLVTVSRERDIPIIRVENAQKLIPVGRGVTINLKEGTLEINSVYYPTYD